MQVKRPDALYLGILLLLSLILHLSFLSVPREVVFDEVHFGTFISSYCCTGEHFFDIHPPHMKLIIAGVGKVAGYDGSFLFSNIGDVYPDTVPIGALRLPAALAGSALPLVLYLLVRQLGGSRLVAFVAGWFIVFDTSITLQSRLIALDSMLLLATFGSLLLFLWGHAASGRQRLFWFLGAGALAGLAAGTKFTGLSALALLGLMVLVSLFKSTDRRTWFYHGVAIIVSFTVVYLAGWAIHFSLLTQPGPGDAFYKPVFDDGFLPVTFIRETVTMHQVMFSANYGLTATHPYASHWWSWPINGRSVFYWQRDGALIYFLGNPLVWWSALGLFIGALVSRVVSFGRGVTQLSVRFGWIPLAGYAISMLPLVRIPRPLFLYHYLTPLLFSLLVGLLWLDRRLMGSIWRTRLYYGALIASALGFIIFSPLVYGIALDADILTWLFWFGSWR